MTATTPQTLPAVLRARTEDDPEQHLAAVGGDWLTVGWVRDRAQRLAAGLFELGVRPGDRVASILPNRPEALELFFACAELGAIHVPLNVYLRGEFLRYQLVDAEPAVLVADDVALPMVSELLADPSLSSCRMVAVDDTGSSVVMFTELYAEPVQRWPDPKPESLMSVLYTSGTTGMPKGCMINHAYCVHWPMAHLRFEWFKPTDTSLCPLPLYHGFALSALMDAVVAGCRVSFDPVFSASAFVDRAREIGATQVFGVGAIAAAVLATPPRPDDTNHSIERAVFVPMSPQAQREFEDRFGVQVICEGYGQTEVLPATMGGYRANRDKPSAGRRLPWLDVQVVDDDDQVLPVGAVGEIVVRPLQPNTIFAGYWRKPAETIKAWRNLWHHTGDLGYFDEDGMLHFVDRKKDAIRRRGENVSSVELEQAIARHPAIAQVAVHATPSELSEDDIKACIVLKPGASVTPEELFEYFCAHVPYYAVPRYIEFLDELPVNAVGRVLKHKLRESWDSPGTIDLTARGLRIDRSARR